MSMVKSSVAKAVAAAVALSAAGAASAAITDTPSDLFIAVWNPSTSQSFVQDLGSAFSNTALNSTFDTAGFSTTFSVDSGSLSSAIGSGTYTFVLFAGDLTQHTTHTCGGLTCSYLGDSMFYSQTAGGTLTPEANQSVIGGASALVSGYVNNNHVGTTGFAASDNHGANSTYWAAASNVNAPGPNFQLGGYSGSATSGSAGVNLVKYLATSTNDGGADPTTASFVGTSSTAGIFKLDGSGNLSYSVGGVTGVPLPAAAWLLVSGLLGLGAVGRRKAAASAA
jgi:hypothetical protein